MSRKKTKRCRYGKLKRPIGRRRCKQPRKASRKSRRHARRRSASRGAVRLPFLVAGLATVALAAGYWSTP